MSAISLLNPKAEFARAAQALAINVSAGKGIQDVMKTNLGPKGTMKMYVFLYFHSKSILVLFCLITFCSESLKFNMCMTISLSLSLPAFIQRSTLKKLLLWQSHHKL